ncbi:MAG: Endonuclease/exonuclease/phosphatase [Bacteroidetes bacterium]|nr:Endonuclease/exonuclease/phosphatase [Bacteroidota bacterium]
MKVFFASLVLLFVFCDNAYSQDSPDLRDTSAIRIMTYNVKMLPRILTYIHHKPIKRARLIPQFLIAENVDMIVLEETFDYRADQILKRKLRTAYPYIYGPANKKGGGTMFSSGVMILSKYPMKRLEEIKFKSCSGDDCWARKGAMLVELTVKGHTIQFMGTHLQAGGTPQIKRDQYAQIEAMLERHARPGVPQILGGDYNTFRSDTVLYPTMLSILHAEDGPISGDIQFTSDDIICDMSENYCRTLAHYEQDIIDYILYKGNGLPHRSVTRRITRYMTLWDIDHRDLSDHMTLIMDLKL